MIRSTADQERVTNPSAVTATSSHKMIILLHGFAAHWLLMSRLKGHFESSGYRTLNWGYNSWFRSIDEHAARLQQDLSRLESDPAVSSIDLVTHSMGCIVTRAALLLGKPSKLGRWVMLAPPNRGSHIATACPTFVKNWLKPVEQLQTHQTSYVNQLPIPPGVEIAVVQATADYIVAESLTRIPEEIDRMIVPGLHSQMLFRKDVAEESLKFLKHGRFSDSVTRKPRPSVNEAQTTP